jgi:hypothetical protein
MEPLDSRILCRTIGQDIYGNTSAKSSRHICATCTATQGSFKGGHYVELSEEANGAQPVHLFNFHPEASDLLRHSRSKRAE